MAHMYDAEKLYLWGQNIEVHIIEIDVWKSSKRIILKIVLIIKLYGNNIYMSIKHRRYQHENDVLKWP